MNGYWHGHYGPGWGWGGGWGWGFGAGMAAGLGFGMLAWDMGSMGYNWGYLPYANPYVVTVPQTVIVSQPYDYSQPIVAPATAPEQATVDAAEGTIDAARASFRSGDYAGCLTAVDQAIRQVPDDVALHQLRGVTLFALGRYPEAASTLYAVLSVGPGWDWTTLAGLYADPATFTTQLRALEADLKAHPDATADRFVLAYLYMTEGFNDQAAAQFQQVLKATPTDRLSAQLLAQLKPATPTPGTPAAPAATGTPEAPAADARTFPIAGSWAAKPAGGDPITLTVGADNTFQWSVAHSGSPRTFQGTASYGSNLLTLAPPAGQPMVGKVVWQDADHFTFHAGGGGASDPGLSFTRGG